MVNIKRRAVLFILCVLLTLVCAGVVCSCSLLGGDEDGYKEKDYYQLDSAFTYVETDDCVYDGTPKTPAVRIYDVKDDANHLIYTAALNDELIDVAYSSNVDSGTAFVTLWAKENVEGQKFLGSKTLTFTIEKGSLVAVNGEDELEAELNAFNYRKIVIGGDMEIGEKKQLTVQRGCVLDFNGKTVVNLGRLNVSGTVHFPAGSVYYSDLFTTFTVGNRRGNYTSEAGATIYADPFFDESAGDGSCTVIMRNYPYAEVSFGSFSYDGTAHCPAPIGIRGTENVDYTIRYINNVNVGNGIAEISATPRSSYYVGSGGVPFIIAPVEITVKNDAELYTARQNDNNRLIKLDGQFTDVTVPRLCTYTFTGGEIAGDVTVERGAELCIDAELTLYKKTAVEGTLTVNECLFIDKGASFEGSGGITLNKSLFSDCGQNFKATGKVNANYPAALNKREELVYSSAYFTNNSLYYNGAPQNNTLKITKRHTADDCTITYRYEGGEPQTEFILPGVVCCDIVANKYSKNLFGSVTKSYEIKYGNAAVRSVEAFYSALGDEYYSKVTIISALSFDDLTVPEGKWVVIDAGATLKNTGRVEISGTLENKGYYVETSSSSALFVSGSFVNSGDAYFNDTLPSGWVSSGRVYVRSEFAESNVLYGQTAFLNEYDSATIEYSVSAAGGEPASGTDYTAALSNNGRIGYTGSNGVLTVTPAERSRYFYGSALSFEFAIDRSHICVFSEAQLNAALSAVNGDNLPVYTAVDVESDFTVASSNNVTKQFTVAEGVTLDMTEHKVSFRRWAGDNYIYLRIYGTVLIPTDFSSDGVSVTIGENGRLAVGVTAVSEITSVLESCTVSGLYIKLLNDLGSRGLPAHFTLGKSFSVTLDLNGHTVYGNISASLSHRVCITSSSGRGTVSAIYSNAAIIPLDFNTGNAAHAVQLENLYIYGSVDGCTPEVDYFYSNSGQVKIYEVLGNVYISWEKL